MNEWNALFKHVLVEKTLYDYSLGLLGPSERTTTLLRHDEIMCLFWLAVSAAEFFNFTEGIIKKKKVKE